MANNISFARICSVLEVLISIRQQICRLNIVNLFGGLFNILITNLVCCNFCKIGLGVALWCGILFGGRQDKPWNYEKDKSCNRIYGSNRWGNSL